MEINEKIREGWIHAVLIIEIAGKPAEHVENTLKLLIDNFEKEKGIEMLGKELFKPKHVEIEQFKDKDIFSAFAEIEVLIKGLGRLLEIVFEYMPSSVEIMEPEEIRFGFNDANAFINDLAAKLHKYDATVKTLGLQNLILKRQIEDNGKQVDSAVAETMEIQRQAAENPTEEKSSESSAEITENKEKRKKKTKSKK